MDKLSIAPLSEEFKLTPLYSTRPMREVMKILNFLCKSKPSSKESLSDYELELNRLAVIFPNIPQERSQLHWVNKWGVSLKKESEPIHPVSCASYLFENCHFPQACSQTIDFSFLKLDQPSLSSLTPDSEIKTALYWISKRIQKWGKFYAQKHKNSFSFHLLKPDSNLQTHENLLFLLAKNICKDENKVKECLSHFDKEDYHLLNYLCEKMNFHPEVDNSFKIKIHQEIAQFPPFLMTPSHSFPQEGISVY